MHTIPHTPSFDSLRHGEKIFLEAWFNLTHERSLDSYRVRFHNGRTILEELHREMRVPVADAEDLGTISVEAREICKLDHILHAVLGPTWATLAALLDGDPKAKKEKPELSGARREQITFILDDTLSKIPPVYLKRTLTALEEAIDGEQDADILRLCDALATDLCARGWAVGSLHTWVRWSFLAPARQNIPFMEHFRFFSARLQQEPEDHTVTLELSGGKTLKALTEFAGFTFSAQPPADTPENPGATQALTKFLQVNPLRVYASTTIKAVDQNSAALEALEKFAHCQDRLRFNYCDQPIVREGQRVLVRRNRDQKQKVVPVVYGIPNPEHHLPLAKFLTANRLLDEMFAAGQIEKNSQRRVEAAVRQYRLGLDTGGYPDKLLNWWMGLETLTNTGGGGKGGIGGRVVSHAAPLLCHQYFQTQLRTLSRVAHMALGKRWPDSVVALVGGDATPLKPLNWLQLLTVLQDMICADAVVTATAGNPWVQIRWARFRDLITNADKLAVHLQIHEQRLTWHLQRLYRIRCCLVHGTPIGTPLQLPAANLEYYLREAIYRVLIALGRSKNLHSLENVFDRAVYCKERRTASLATKLTPAGVRETLLADLTFNIVS